MLLSRRPDFICDTTHKIAKYIITNSAEDLGDPGKDDNYGHGRVNAYRALLAVIRGDVNTDGVINVLDVVYLLNYVYKNWDPPQLHVCVGDCNCDGAVNPVDVARLVNYVYKGHARPQICFDYMED